MFVSVLDKGGQPVPGLGADEFVVRENGARREVLRVEQPAREPIEITLLIDNTAVSEPYIQDLRAGLRAFLAGVRQGNVVALETYAARPTVVVEHTNDLARVERGAGRLFAQPDDGAYLLEALVETSRGIMKREAPRAAIVAISFEGPELDETYYGEVLQALTRSRASLSALVFYLQRANPRNEGVKNRSVVLDEGPKRSGGVRYDLLTSMALPNRFALIARQLMNQYRIVYARPESLIPPDRFEVSVTRPGLEAHATAPQGGSR